jgi:hypothetical protein
MALAMIYPEPAELKRKGSGSIAAIEQGGVSQQRLSHARTVLKHTPDVAPAVVAGAVKLDDAYQKALRIVSVGSRADRTEVGCHEAVRVVPRHYRANHSRVRE